MKKNMLLLLSFIVFINSLIAQNYTRLWVNKFADSTASWHTNDMATDAKGNAYLTGYFTRNNDNYYQTHLFLMKINTAGQKEWMRYFSNTLDSIDAGTAVAVDSFGFVYVTGNRKDTFCNICTVNSKISDIITMKYDAAGNRIWLNRYHDSLYVLATPSDMQVQPNGTLCIAGNEDRYNFTTSEYSGNMLLQKINANGKTAWVRKKNFAVGNAVCFDKNNNIIVAGASDPSNIYQTQKPAIYKYNGLGIFQYSALFDERSRNGRFLFVACDNNNNVYANGQTDTIAFNNNPQILTAKYTAAGVQLWFRKEQSHSNTAPHLYGGFAIDEAGNSFITGYIKVNSINNDIITTKYNCAGARQWIQTFDGPLYAYDVPVDIATDKKGNVFVTGSTSAKGGYDYVTLGYTGNGTQIGVDYYSSGAGTSNFTNSVNVDNSGNVLVTGITKQSLTTIKYGKKTTLIVQAESKDKANSIRMYPNPAKDNITILYNASSSIQTTECFITDMYGNVLLQKRMPLNNGKGNLKFTLQALNTGIYVVKIKEGSQFISKSFLKE